MNDGVVGGIIVMATDILLQCEDALPKVIQMLENDRSLRPEQEWIIKIHKTTIKAVNTFATSSEM